MQLVYCMSRHWSRELMDIFLFLLLNSWPSFSYLAFLLLHFLHLAIFPDVQFTFGHKSHLGDGGWIRCKMSWEKLLVKKVMGLEKGYVWLPASDALKKKGRMSQKTKMVALITRYFLIFLTLWECFYFNLSSLLHDPYSALILGSYQGYDWIDT